MPADSNQLSDPDMAGVFDDSVFSSVQFDDYSNHGSPFDTTQYFDLGADSPDYNPRTPTKPLLETEKFVQQRPSQSVLSSRSAESSSEDSASETSATRKRKTTSESPPTANLAGLKMNSNTMLPDSMDMDNAQSMHPMSGLDGMSLDQDMMNPTLDLDNTFDFDSPASSAEGLEQNPYIRAAMQNARGPPVNTLQPPLDPSSADMALQVGTVEPAQFFIHASGDSPSSAHTNAMADGQSWGGNAAQGWLSDYGPNYASPNALGLTPSPVTHPRNLATAGTVSNAENGLIPLHIGAIPAKSRVETQINIRMTIERLPAKVSNLHLPTHTIAKAKLLNKDVPLPEETLEMHTMLVCTSAMHIPKSRENALRKAAAQSNATVQARGVAGGQKREESDMSDDDKPANGGEVRICQNCINRERKRAARKKLKKEEEQAHWEKYETERVIVFNTNEYKSWQDWQAAPPQKDITVTQAPSDTFAPTDTSMQIIAPMRIACYCRHQNEKDGFQVIFTLKDHTGTVVAQAISESILITDDHKTHPMSAVNNQIVFDGQFPPGAFASQSMVDLPSHMAPLPISKSTGNLSDLSFNQATNFHGSSSLHQLSNYNSSQNTSATMTPRNLSRPASPTGLIQAGPSKKRKSSSTHRKLPSGLAMTKVDSSQPTGNTSSSALAGALSPTSAAAGFMMTGTNHRNNADGQSYNYRALNRTTSFDQNTFQAFYSAPNSAHQSRSGSPVLQGPNLGAFQRQQSARPNQYPSKALSNHSQSNLDIGLPEAKAPPIINKVVPSEGPNAGGIEVSIYGQNFTPGMEVMFGDLTATATTYWGEKALCCVLPPSSSVGPSVGPVQVSIAGFRSVNGNRLSAPHHSSATTFVYGPPPNDIHMMEMALRFYSLEMTGNEENWQSTAQDAAARWQDAATRWMDATVTAQQGDTSGGPGGQSGGRGDSGSGMPGAFPS